MEEKPTLRGQSPVKDVFVGRECRLALSIRIDWRGRHITGTTLVQGGRVRILGRQLGGGGADVGHGYI